MSAAVRAGNRTHNMAGLTVDLETKIIRLTYCHYLIKNAIPILMKITAWKKPRNMLVPELSCTYIYVIRFSASITLHRFL